MWGGYYENQSENDQYWNSSEVMIYNSLTQTWTSQRTTGEVPSKCSGAAATGQHSLSPSDWLINDIVHLVIGDVMYVVAGFHKVVISTKQLREGRFEVLDTDGSFSLSDSDSEEEGLGDIDSVEISNKIWSLDLNTFVWTRLSPEGLSQSE